MKFHKLGDSRNLPCRSGEAATVKVSAGWAPCEACKRRYVPGFSFSSSALLGNLAFFGL